eukprot:2962897-Amphidinium_carterae.1
MLKVPRKIVKCYTRCSIDLLAEHAVHVVLFSLLYNGGSSRRRVRQPEGHYSYSVIIIVEYIAVYLD